MSCGSSFAATCPTCGAEVPAGAKFCIECGTALGGPAPTAAEPPPEERRQATVLFADLSGYTAVSERVDPERMKALIDRSLRRLGVEVERHGGSIDKFIGDNVMGVFGAPVAHEDDPERAVRAGLAMQAAMAEINERIESDLGESFSLRVGINSGEVLAGRVGDGYTVIGDSVNVAARLQAASTPGTVIVGETHPPADPRRDRVRRARAAHGQGQGRAGAGLGGGAGGRARARGACQPDRGAAGRPRGRGRPAALALRADAARVPAAPGHDPRAGRGRQVAADARAVPAARRAASARRPCGSAPVPRTAPASPTGRWPRSCAAPSTSSTPTTPAPPGASSTAASQR